MPPLDFPPQVWLLGLLTALFVGFSKTGLPGAGVLVVPLMANAFGARLSVGALLPMLIMGDLFAMAWYRKHAQLDKIWSLIPWVLAGMGLGGVLLVVLGDRQGKDLLNPVIGLIVLAMLALNLLRRKLGDRLTPHSPTGRALTGAAAGFSTSVSNAGGPVMAIYLQGAGLDKAQMIGTNGWYFFVFNLVKVPLYVAVTFAKPEDPLWNAQTFLFNAVSFPVIAAGAFLGRWMLPRIDQRLFDALVLILAAVAAVRLVIS